jgi:hypothetical protein
MLRVEPEVALARRDPGQERVVMNSRRVESFLLRLVVTEEQAACPEHWHGRIQHVASGVEQQVSDFSEVLAFIRSRLPSACDCGFEIETAAVSSTTERPAADPR